MSHLETQITAFCLKCYISTKNAIEYVARGDFNAYLNTIC